MKKLVCIVLALIMALCTVGTSLAAYKRPDVPDKTKTYIYWDPSYTAEERAADLISHMSLEEKIFMLASHPFYDATINSVARLGVANYGYPGEALNGIDNVRNWYGVAMEGEGASSTFVSTLGYASTWDPELVAQMADVIADEVRAYYNTSNKGLSHWAPTINLFREPRWGRADEAYSEDVILTSIMAGAFVRGFQGELDENPFRKAIATLKHYAANNSEATRSFGSSNMSEAELREYYTRTFKNIVEDYDAGAVMASYNAINGTPNHANYDLLTAKLRETFGFKGFVIGDLGGVRNLWTQYGVDGGNTTNEQRAAFGAEYYPTINVFDYATDSAAYTTAGGSLELGTATDGNAFPNGQRRGAADAVAQGLMTEEDINNALMDLLYERILTGEFDIYAEGYENSYDDYTSVRQMILSDEHVAMALKTAEDSIVLLENDGVLPVDAKQYNNVVVVGLMSDTMLYSGYTSIQTEWKEAVNINVWDGLKAAYEAANPEGTITYIKPDCEMNVTQSMWGGQTVTAGDISLSDEMKQQIAAADLVIYDINTASSDSREGRDRIDMTLPRNQGPVAKEILELNDNVVIFMNTIAQYELDDMQDESNSFLGRALIWGTYLGERQGEAIANIIFGKTSPSGHLTVTWYEDVNELGDFDGVGAVEQHDYTLGINDTDNQFGRTYMYFRGGVEYPFGYGLTYTDISYGDVKLSKSEDVSGDDTIVATVSLTNNGDIGGSEVVELYVQGPRAGAILAEDGVSRPVIQLMGFQKVFVDAGETVEVAIPFDMVDMSYWSEEDNKFEMDLGEYVVSLREDCQAEPYTSTTLTVTKDITESPKTVTLYTDRMVAYELGQEVGTCFAVAMQNDLLYTADAEKPEGLAISYASSNENVATVSQDGMITTVGEGVATITATVSYNGGEAVGTAPIAVNLDRNPWTDVEQGDAVYEAATYLWDKGIVGIEHRAAESAGNQVAAYVIADSEFRPADAVTRIELARMLFNATDIHEVTPVQEGTEWLFPFADVTTESPDYEAALWAYEKELLSGASTAEFGADGALTAEEAVKALNAFAALIGSDAAGLELSGASRGDVAIALVSIIQ